MYSCLDCGLEFEYVEIVIERHNLDTPPFERLKLCPGCHGQNFKQIRESYCGYCGTAVKKGEEFCNEFCKNALDKLYKEREERRIKYESSLMGRAMKELELYNKIHNTNYSYGEYFALKKGGKI